MGMEKEIRTLPAAIEVRSGTGEGETRTIAGSIQYNVDSEEMNDVWGDPYVEEIASGAFDESLASRGVVALWSHDTGRVLGNTKSNTLRISNSKEKLDFEMDIPDTADGNDAWTLINRGDVDGVSFGMRVTKQKWSSEMRGDKKVYKRSVLAAELYEISPVAFPAYPANEVTARSLEEFKKEEAKAEQEIRKRKLTLELEL